MADTELTGNPYEYIDEILKFKSREVLTEGNRTHTFWGDCPPDAFKPHPDARKSILFKPR